MSQKRKIDIDPQALKRRLVLLSLTVYVQVGTCSVFIKIIYASQRIGIPRGKKKGFFLTKNK